MSETQKQYFKQLNGYLVKDAEARAAIETLNGIVTLYTLNAESKQGDLSDCLTRYIGHGVPFAYDDEYGEANEVERCTLLGYNILDNTVYFFNSATKEVLSIALVTVAEEWRSEGIREPVRTKLLDWTDGDRITALENAAPASTFDKECDFYNVELAYYAFLENGTPFIYLDDDNTPCIFVGAIDFAGTTPSICFLKASTKQLIKVSKKGVDSEGNSVTEITYEDLITETYDEENESLTISW